MTKVTIKNTKQEILEAYSQAIEKIRELKNTKSNTTEIVKEQENEKIIASANEIVGLNILNENILEKFTSLDKAIKLKNEQLQELFEIESNANSLEALINASKDKEKEIKDKFIALEKELRDRHVDLRKELEKEFEEKKINIQKAVENLNEQYKIRKEELEKQRIREQADYEYNKKIERKQESDVWENEKHEREKDLVAKEKDLDEREANLKEKEELLETLKEQVADIPNQIKTAQEDAVKHATDKLYAKHTNEKQMLEKESEWKDKMAQEQINRLNNDLNKANETINELNNKLSDSYKEIKEIATQTVQSTGGVKILESKKE